MRSRWRGSSRRPLAWRPGATAAARLGGGDLAAVRRGVRSLSRVLGSEKPPQATPARYDLALIQADTDPVKLADRLASSGEQGPPGTGKSAFVRYLAERLGVEVVQKRASDLMSMWVGQTEQQIAAAFAEARDSGAFLVFDEGRFAALGPAFRAAKLGDQPSERDADVDGEPSRALRLHDKLRHASRSGDATAFRVQGDAGLLGAGAGAGRRFQGYFGLEPPAGVAALTALTPGDFAVVRRKAEVLGCLGDPDALATMLRAECDAKPDCPADDRFSGRRRQCFGRECSKGAEGACEVLGPIPQECRHECRHEIRTAFLQLPDQMVVVRMRADPEPCNTVIVSLADGPVCDPDADGIDTLCRVNALEAQARAPRIFLETPERLPRLTLDRLRQRRKSIAETSRDVGLHRRVGSSSSVNPKRCSSAASAASRSSKGREAANARSHRASSSISCFFRRAAGGTPPTSRSDRCRCSPGTRWRKRNVCTHEFRSTDAVRSGFLWRLQSMPVPIRFASLPQSMKNDVFAAFVDDFNDSIRETLPTFVPVRAGGNLHEPSTPRSARAHPVLPKVSGNCCPSVPARRL